MHSSEDCSGSRMEEPEFDASRARDSAGGGSSHDDGPRRVIGEESPGAVQIGDDRKEAALAHCHVEHEELLKCMKTSSVFAGCPIPHKAFWDCYTAHRGTSDTRLTSFFTWKKKSSAGAGSASS